MAYSVLPVIAEVSRQNGIRPERPMSMAVIVSQFAIVASPIAAAVVAVVCLPEPQGIHLGDVFNGNHSFNYSRTFPCLLIC